MGLWRAKILTPAAIGSGLRVGWIVLMAFPTGKIS
jgi:hypothetical protein